MTEPVDRAPPMRCIGAAERGRAAARRWRVGGLLVVIAVSGLIWLGLGALVYHAVH